MTTKKRQPNRTTLKVGDNLPARGKSFKTKLLETIREEALLEVGEGATPQQAEKAYIHHMAKRAFNPEDPNSGMLLKSFNDKAYPPLKATLEAVSFIFPEDGTDLEKSVAVLDAIAIGDLSADVGQIIMGIIKDNSIIEHNTCIKDRIIEIEKKLGIQVE